MPSRTRRPAAALTLFLGLVLPAACAEPVATGPNQLPSARITAPATNATFYGGDSIAYAGSATDHEDGAEPGTRLTWWVELHHDTHTHPFLPRTSGASGKFYVPPIGETSDNVFLRMYLEAVDDSGGADTVTRDILPQKSQFTLVTEPAGLMVKLDGQPQATPLTITGVVGMERELSVTSPQSSGGTDYRFGSWSDGGAMTHRISTPGSATTYTATFTAVPNVPPTVALTAPTSGGSATINTAVALAAMASDADGTVAKVGFYDGGTLLGEDTTAPYTWSWIPGSSGSHSLTARATDNDGAATTSSSVAFTVTPAANQVPSAQITAPAPGTILVRGTATTLTATASDPDGSVSRVQFYDGTTLLGEDSSSPYSLVWTPSTTGSHALSARAVDNLGAVGLSASVTISVSSPPNVAPSVSLTAPASGATLVMGSATTLTASASDLDGSVTKVAFYDGTTLLGEDTAAPYSLTWTPGTTGSHTLSARATDNDGAVGTSASVSVTVSASGPDTQAPTLSLTSPAAQATNLSGTITLMVTANDNVGVTGVEYQVDADAAGQASAAPWSLTLGTTAWTTGVHVIRARARDAAGNYSPWSAARVTFGNNVDRPSGFTRSVYVSALTEQGTAMAWSPDGRLFVCEQGGALRVVKNGALLSTPFALVSTSPDGERGLLGVAFHPNFASNGWVYVYYTSSAGGAHNRISRFTASGDVAQAGSEVVLVDLPLLSVATNHNGGALHFGPDGKLYVAVGDNATGSNAQDMGIPFGKMLRFNDDGSIPTDNPFYGSASGINRSIWALGLRNPFSFAFDPNGSRMFINDVGQNLWEEIDVGARGANYGWPDTEGATSNPAFTTPLFTYAHSSNSTLVVGAAIVGGTFYRPASVDFPSSWVGNYFFGDYVDGWINRLDTANGNAVYAFARESGITDMTVGPDGALYVLAATSGNHSGILRFGH